MTTPYHTCPSICFPTFCARLNKQHHVSYDAMQNLSLSDTVSEDSRHLGCMQQVPNLRSELGLELLHLLLFEPCECPISLAFWVRPKLMATPTDSSLPCRSCGYGFEILASIMMFEIFGMVLKIGDSKFRIEFLDCFVKDSDFELALVWVNL